MHSSASVSQKVFFLNYPASNEQLIYCTVIQITAAENNEQPKPSTLSVATRVSLKPFTIYGATNTRDPAKFVDVETRF